MKGTWAIKENTSSSSPGFEEFAKMSANTHDYQSFEADSINSTIDDNCTVQLNCNGNATGGEGKQSSVCNPTIPSSVLKSERL